MWEGVEVGGVDTCTKKRRYEPAHRGWSHVQRVFEWEAINS